MEIRQTVESDLKGQYQVFVKAESEISRRAGVEWTPEPFNRWRLTQEHLLRVDGERCYVATLDDRVIGFSAALRRGNASFLAALFILPEHQGHGLGRKLCALSLNGMADTVFTITDSFQPASAGLYSRWGLFPQTPVMMLSGSPNKVDSPELEEGLPGPASLLDLDMACYGFDRQTDHQFWRSAAQPTLWLDRGQPVAYSYRSNDGTIGPLAGRTAKYAAQALDAELYRTPGQKLRLFVPGSSYALIATALKRQLRYVGPPGLLLGNSTCRLPTALAISGYWLM